MLVIYEIYCYLVVGFALGCYRDGSNLGGGNVATQPSEYTKSIKHRSVALPESDQIGSANIKIQSIGPWPSPRVTRSAQPGEKVMKKSRISARERPAGTSRGESS